MQSSQSQIYIHMHDPLFVVQAVFGMTQICFPYMITINPLPGSNKQTGFAESAIGLSALWK